MFLAIAVHIHLYKEYLRTQVSSYKSQYIYCKLSLYIRMDGWMDTS